MSSSTTTKTTPPNQLFLGTFIHPTSQQDELEYLHNTAVFVEGASGKIVAVEKDVDRTRTVDEVLVRLGWSAAETKIFDAAAAASHHHHDGKEKRHNGGGVRFFFPGFVDTHIHASQYPNAGIFGKSTLLDWLNTYTFPLEASLGQDLAKAKKVYGRCVRRTLAHGTTCAAYFATRDVAATNLLTDVCLAAGQRALVGRVCMDERKLCPEWYCDESAGESVQRTREVVEHARAVDPAGEWVRPIVTPRFAPSCTAAAMQGLSDLAKEEALAVQTHISENTGECELVAELFPQETAGGRGYAGVYDAFGLLGDKTILAHAVHLSEQEAKLVAERGAGVSHCPCSNTAITSGAAKVRWLLDHGVNVGLGTDVSGGYSPSVLEAARQASLVSRHVAMGLEGEEKERTKLTVEEVLWLATRGGARLVGLEGIVGGFEVGMEWDAQLVGLGGVEGEDDEDHDAGNVDIFGWESWDNIVAKWLFGGDDRNTTKVWVKGRLVHERA
ncbi:Metallo-dependent hydrolase [Cryphonectria parasitica EP155]|uniref:Probable guanine deaminase n=1 Tax=Cryphonectria parasitica (strain ATCC 38755 / EP155) TaxID=660469 RepID=A0A9P4Y746_CRYP1|nr:Metallo-dependent hydrolase [Cryphonectria parasitica EP155]KAF3767968.1 Metallo-dependent hydrolase [Cryphonectria parasitica EP155]